MVSGNKILGGALLFTLVSTCDSLPSSVRALSNGKVLIDITVDERNRLVERLGFTNSSGGYLHRDSTGDRLWFNIDLRRNNRPPEALLVVVSTNGVRMKPWRIANERMSDDEELAVWEERTNATYKVRSGEGFPERSFFHDTSGDWIALGGQGRSPWLAKLDTPATVAVELPATHSWIRIFAQGQTVHVFSRPGWRNAEGPMRYLVYDFARGSQTVQDRSFSWARAALDMDPSIGMAVIHDNNSFWGRAWLIDLKTGKRKAIRTASWTFFLKRELAEKWIDLTRRRP